MLNYFRNLVSSENDQDPSWIRLVRVVLTVATVATAGIAILEVLFSGKIVNGFFGALILAVLSGAALLLTYRGILWPGRVLLPLSALVVITLLAINADGLHDSAISGFMLVIVLTSLLTGRRAISLATILALIGILIVAYADMAGINKSVLAQRTQWADVVVIGMLQITAAASLNGLLNRMNSALEKSRANEQAQTKSNQELRELQTVLEQRVTERTHSLELAAEVGRAVSQVRELGPMLKDAAEIIRSRFGLYYVQVYLTEPTQNALVLQSGTGTVGAELVNRGHRLPLDTASINGRAAMEKRSVIIADTTSSVTFRPNPLLPDTRSEMAVPLLAGEKVAGVLDLQSRIIGELNQDILPAFEALAGQFAIAIQNANLLAEAERARAEMESQARRLTRANWTDYQDAIHNPEQTGFSFDGNKVVPLEETDELQSPEEGHAISAPIAVTGEPLGSLVVEMETADQSPQDLELINLVARQVGQQIENLRLLESAERYRAEAEGASRRLTHEGWKGYFEKLSGESLGYTYNMNEVKPSSQESEVSSGEPGLTLPLKVRDETVGQIFVQGLAADDNESIGLANAVAERLGAHIEGLRQYDQNSIRSGTI